MGLVSNQVTVGLRVLFGSQSIGNRPLAKPGHDDSLRVNFKKELVCSFEDRKSFFTSSSE
jgi:hypothetical protein